MTYPNSRTAGVRTCRDARAVMVARYGKTEETSYSGSEDCPDPPGGPPDMRVAGGPWWTAESRPKGTSCVPRHRSQARYRDPDLRSEVRQHEVDKQSGVVGGVAHVDDRVRAHPAARAEHNVLKSTVVSTPVTARKA